MLTPPYSVRRRQPSHGLTVVIGAAGFTRIRLRPPFLIRDAHTPYSVRRQRLSHSESAPYRGPTRRRVRGPAYSSGGAAAGHTRGRLRVSILRRYGGPKGGPPTGVWLRAPSDGRLQPGAAAALHRFDDARQRV